MRIGEKENQDQQQGGDAEGGIDELGRFVDVVVHVHEDQHGQDAGQGPGSLPAHIGKLGVIALLGHHRGSRKDHDQPHHNQQQCGEEQPFVDAYALCHTFLLLQRLTSSLKTRPRCS